MRDAIGGYFELDLRPNDCVPHPEALRFQSARAAFLALLRTGKPARVWMPRLICDAMLAPPNLAGITVAFYDVDEDLSVSNEVRLGADDWLLYVNYYGIGRRAEEALLRRFSPSQVVLDRCHALFSRPKDCLANIYSPRKFCGVPDGGFLICQANVPPPEEPDQGSLGRCEHLLLRLHAGPRAGYASFKRAEESLKDVTPRRMSELTARLLANVDFRAARERRNSNFRFLHEGLKHMNRMTIDVEDVDGPLCYPLLCHEEGLRDMLIERSIFVPTYWPEALTRCVDGSVEVEMVRRCLPIPCDQRYDQEDMEAIVCALVARGSRTTEAMGTGRKC